MPRTLTIKDNLRESRLFMSRAIIGILFSLFLLAIVVGRLVFLQIVSHEHFRTLSQDNRVRIVPLPPARGLVFDRNGVQLADNLPAFRLEVTPESATDLEHSLRELGRLINLRPIDLERFHKLRKRMRKFDSVPLRFHLDEAEVARFSVNQYRFPGFEIKAGPSRFYPLGDHTAHILGYVGRIDEKEIQKLDAIEYRGTTHTGKTGVEKFYEPLLHGKVGYQQVETNARGRILRVLKESAPVTGQNLYLSIDSVLQAEAEKAFGDFKGAAVAIDPQTGAVLTMISLPEFDPNPFVNGVDYDVYQALQANHDRPLFNRALRGQYPPGSTLKPFVALAGLNYHVITPASTTFCPGYYILENSEHRFRDWKRWGHNRVNLYSAIAESCDVYFYDLAFSLGIDRIHEFLSRFGFGKKTGIDLSGELSGLLPSREWKKRRKQETWYPGETLITGIGQGFNLATPVQLASATAALAVRGKRFVPRILYATQQGPDGPLEPRLPEPAAPVAGPDSADWDTIIEAMSQVVNSPSGTARKIGKDASYRIAGKTGTAQVFGLKEEEEYDAEELEMRLRDHALFIAFAPIDNPRIAIAVVVENGGSGGAVAAPIARRIMDAYLARSGR